MNRRLIEALRAFNRSQKRQRFVEDEKHTDETRRRSCEMCKATEDDASAKYCAMCGQKLAEIEGYSNEDEISQTFGLPEKSPRSASEDDDEDENEDEDEKRLRGGYGMRTDEARRGARADEAIKTFGRTYKRLRG